MELNFRSNRPLFFITLSTVLHLSAVLLNSNYHISNDDRNPSDFNRRVRVSAVFNENITKTAEDKNSSENREQTEVSDKLYSYEHLENIIPELHSEDYEEIKKNETAEPSERDTDDESDINSDYPENSIADSAETETLTIDSFTTDLNPVYPVFAKKNNYEGIVRVSLTVNRKGRGENVLIIKSSGYSVLDKAALKAVKKAIFKAKTSRTYYLSAALSRPLIVDINFTLTSG